MRQISFFQRALLITFFSVWGTYPMAQAQLEWSEKEFRTKAGPEDAKIKHQFKYKNAGSYPVVIRDIKTSCGCTAASSSKEKIGPGESGWVEAVFDIGNREGDQLKEVRVITDDPEKSNAVLALKVNIPRLVTTDPTSLVISMGDTGEKLINVRMMEGSERKVTSVVARPPLIESEIIEVEAGKHYQVRVTPKNKIFPNRVIVLEMETAPKLPREKRVRSYVRLSTRKRVQAHESSDR